MVVESLIGPRTAERNPSEIMVLAFIFVSMAIGIVDYLKLEPPGAMLLLFTMIPSIPFVLSLFKLEEEELEHETILGSRTLRRHFSVILVMLAFFLGLTIGFTFWYMFLEGVEPGKAQAYFEPQLGELKKINSLQQTLGQFLGEPSAIQAQAAGEGNAFTFIFFHNLRVLLLVILGSVIYGAGSVFILIWNASVISIFLGNVARRFVFNEAPQFSLIPGLSYGVLGLIPHGTFELISYLMGALAGGILSYALTRRVFGTKEFKPIIIDVMKLIGVAVLLLLVGAFIEGSTI